MKKILFFLIIASSCVGQTLRTAIDGGILNQGSKGVTATKLRNVLVTVADSVSGKVNKSGGVMSGGLTATSFVKSGGTSGQFLKANGSVDGTAYLSLDGGVITGNLSVNNVVKVGGSSTFESAYLGQGALSSTTSGTQNTAVGKNALNASTNGSWNSAFGYLALATSTSGTKNTGVGAYSLNGTTTGQYNTAIGWEAGKYNTVGYYNTYIGAFKGTGYSNRSGRIWISDGLGNVRLMIDSLGNAGFGTLNPSATLDVNGTGKFKNIILNSISPLFTFENNSIPAYYTGVSQSNNGLINGSVYGDIIHRTTGGKLMFSTNNGTSSALTVASSGNVGIGITIPTSPFEVVGGQYHTAIATFRPSGTAQNIGLGVESSGANFGASIFQNNVKVFTAESNGGVLIGTNYQESNAPVNGALIEGFLGVGTATPISKLHINTLGSFENYATIGNSNGGIMIGVNEYGGGRILNYAAKGIVFGGNYNSSETEQMRIAANGNVGIGNPAPEQKLDVGGIAQATQFKVSVLNTAPSSSSATGTVGEVRFTATHIYVCTATNTWVRSALVTW